VDSPIGLSRFITDYDPFFTLESGEILAGFFKRLPNLRIFRGVVPRGFSPPFVFPTWIQKLHMMDYDVGERTNTLLHAVAHQLQHLENFCLSFYRLHSRDTLKIETINFALLHDAPRLSRFILYFPEAPRNGSLHLEDRQIRDLRTLPLQTILPCDADRNRNLAVRLLQHPAPPLWTSLGEGFVALDAETSKLLPTLPSLTHLATVFRDTGDATCLAALVGLRELVLNEKRRIPAAQLMLSLQKMHKLTRLTLMDCNINSDVNFRS